MTVRTAVGGASATLDTTGMTFIAVFTATSNLQVPTDSEGNTWTSLSAYTTNTGMRARWSYVRNPTTDASHTFSQNQSFSSIFVYATDEIDVSADPIDVSNGNNNNSTSTTTLSVGSVTTTNANSVLLAGICHAADYNSPTGSYSIDNSFSVDQSRTAIVAVRIGGAIASRTVSSTLTVNPAFSWSGGNPTSGAIAAFKGASSGGVTGTSATTNANDTSNAAGSTTIVGSSATTNANDTATASGATTVTGSSATTNANDTAAASGSTTIVGSVAATNANDTSTATGTVGSGITGTVDYTNEDDFAAASGWVASVGSASITNANDTASASGFLAITGSLATTNANDVAAASGTSGAVAVKGSYLAIPAQDHKIGSTAGQWDRAWYEWATNVNRLVNRMSATGTTPQRPTTWTVGVPWFDQSLGKPVWWNGTGWVDANGSPS